MNTKRANIVAAFAISAAVVFSAGYEFNAYEHPQRSLILHDGSSLEGPATIGEWRGAHIIMQGTAKASNINAIGSPTDVAVIVE